MKKIYLYFSMLVSLFLISCQDEEVVSQPNLKPNEYLFSISIPESTVATRVMGDVPSENSIKNMTVLVFDEYGLFLASRKATVTLDNKTEGKLTVELPPSNTKRILHFVAGDVAFGDYSRSDSETEIFSNLSVTDRKDAYWCRAEVSKIKEADAVKAEVGTIKLIRNFAKISLTKNDISDTQSLELVGFTIVNATNTGSVAPYMGGEQGGFANFVFNVDGDEDVYTAFTKQNKGFVGNTQGEIEDATFDDDDFLLGPQYVYERRQVDATNPAYILLKARYRGEICYYKLDIVKTDPVTYITSYLNLYRNFHYAVKINKVVGMGYLDMEQAMNAAASNNLSASVEVSQVNRIEDGTGNSLEVSTMDVMLVNTQPYTITYEYMEANERANEKVIVTPVADTEDGINHNAVQRIENDKNGNITIIPVDHLPANLETQDFIVSTPSGLARRISVKVRQPYKFDIVMCQNQVERKINATMAVGMRLPVNMPVAVFPLTFRIEPEKKSIYPNVDVNSIPVEAGDHSFNYMTTISYNDYRQSRTFYFHFKTNMVDSETSITVSNPYFKDVPENTVSFENTNNPIAGFSPIKFGPVGGTLQDMDNVPLYSSVPRGIGQEMELQFTLDEGHEDVVGIYAGDYLEFARSSTGSAVPHESNGGWAYTANNSTGIQSVIFKTTAELVGGLLELYSMKHALTTFAYRNSPVTLTVKYLSWSQESNVPEGESIDIYKDSNYTEHAATLTVGNDGKLTMVSFAGNKYEDILYFRYVNRYTIYNGFMSVREIINGGTGGNTIVLKRNN